VCLCVHFALKTWSIKRSLKRQVRRSTRRSPGTWNGEPTTPARAHRKQHFQPNNLSTATRFAPESNQTNTKGPNDLANAFQTSCPNSLPRKRHKPSDEQACGFRQGLPRPESDKPYILGVSHLRASYESAAKNNETSQAQRFHILRFYRTSSARRMALAHAEMNTRRIINMSLVTERDLNTRGSAYDVRI
jgi:hypothetical protein